MSKYLIRTQASIYLEPQNVYDLKKDLLLFDKLGMLNLYKLLEALHEYKKYPVFQNALNEIEFLIREGLFVELTSLGKETESITLDEDERELADYTMKLMSALHDTPQSDKKWGELYWKHDELNTRFWSNAINKLNEAVYTVPALKDYSSFSLPQTAKDKAYSIIHNLVPIPDKNTSWEKILEIKNDPESQLKLFELRNWMNVLPENIRQEELVDKILYLKNQYSENLKKHKVTTRLSTIKTVVNAIPEALSEVLRLRFEKAIGAFFKIAEQQINFQTHKQKSELSGHEIAYISHLEYKLKK